MDAELVNDTSSVDANVIIRSLAEKITELTVQSVILKAQLDKALLSSIKK